MKWLGAHLGNKLLAGLLAAIPLAVVIYIFALIESTAQPLIEPVLGVRIPGLPILVALVAIYLLGVMVTSIFGTLALWLLDWLLQRLPGFSMLYQAWKDVVLLPPDRPGTLSETVLVPAPEGGHALGFTSGVPLPGPAANLVVFLPNVPNPLTGRLVIVPRDRCLLLKANVAEGFKFFLSTGNHQPAGLQGDAKPT